MPHIRQRERDGQHFKESSLICVQALQGLELKPWDNALVDGLRVPGLKVSGERGTTSHDGFCG